MSTLALPPKLALSPFAAVIRPPYVTSTSHRAVLTCGVASAGQIDDCTPDLLLATADAALYQAKAAGRNCTVLAKEAVRPSSPASQRLQQNGIVSEVIEDESSIVGLDDD